MGKRKKTTTKKAKSNGELVSVELETVIHHRGVVYEGKVEVTQDVADRLKYIDNLRKENE